MRYSSLPPPSPSPDSYIIVLKDTATLAGFEPALNEIARRHNGTSIAVNHRYDTFLSLTVTTSDATALLDVVTSAQIASLEQDAVATAQSSQPYQPSWARPVSNYLFNDDAGESVTAYILDMGIYVGHDDFQGRASWGTNLIDRSKTLTITVAESTFPAPASYRNDKTASLTPYGSYVEIFAPGVDITSSWIGSPSSTDIISGTSTSSAHVAGVVALFLSRNKLSPKELFDKSIHAATPGTITGDMKGSPNSLDYVNNDQ
ncbi:hypothetical protein BG005_002785 [Podila minutissima]|nr:hypothetical protein BG005_002785 [Podila minutissima]